MNSWEQVHEHPRRSAAFGGLSLLTRHIDSTISRAELGSFLGIGEGVEDFWLATDAYIYGYPLVTMEMTRRVITNVARAGRHRGPMGQIIKLREYPDAVVPGRHGAQRRHALHDRVPRRRQGAVGTEPARHEGPLCLFPMLDGWTNGLRGPRQAHHRHRRPDLRDHRPRLEGHAAGRREGVQVADQHRLAARPHLLHRHARGLRRGPRAAGRVQARAAQRLRQGVHAAGGQGRPVDRHEDGGARPGQPDGRGRIFHAARAS